jgi:fatty acid amide hydrolase
MFGGKCADALRGSAGLPVGVQVVSRPYREDVALSIMAVIEEAARGQRDYPRTPIEPIAG